MSNVLSDTKKQQIIALGRLGWALRRIERETGIRRETAGSYLRAAGVKIRSQRKRLLAETGAEEAVADLSKPANEVTIDSAKPASEVTTDSAKPASEVTTDSVKPADDVASATIAPDDGGIDAHRDGQKRSASACAQHHEFIARSLVQGRNSVAIWQDLVDINSFSGAYTSVRRYVSKLRAQPSKQACAIIETAAGEEAQVDYGEGPMVLDDTGKYRRTRLFVMTLGFSRKSIRLLVWKSSSKIWAQLHEKAFQRLGGVPSIVVLDNLREGVIKPDVYDPALNHLYRDVLAHYGVTAMPCRVRHPDRKGKVESAIGHTQGTRLKGQRFDSLELAQKDLDHWDARWADTRIHGTTKRQVSAMFAEEKPFLKPLPVTQFYYYEYGSRKVHLDGCVEVCGAYYSAPPGMIGHLVQVQWNDLQVRLLSQHTGELLREHQRQRRGLFRVKTDDISPRTPQPVTSLLHRATVVGKHIGVLCETIYSREGDLGVRRIMGILGLTKKHGARSVDDACAAALDVRATTYQFVRRYLDHHPAAKLTLKQVDPLIRQLNHYRDIINHIAKEPSA